MKQENEKLEYKVFTRIGKSKYYELSQMLDNSPYRTMSSLIRNILVHGKITILTRDITLDQTMERLSRICTELRAIGNNINQVTRRIYVEDLPQDQADIVLDMTRFNQQADERVKELLDIAAKLSYKWLPE